METTYIMKLLFENWRKYLNEFVAVDRISGRRLDDMTPDERRKWDEDRKRRNLSQQYSRVRQEEVFNKNQVLFTDEGGPYTKYDDYIASLMGNYEELPTDYDDHVTNMIVWKVAMEYFLMWHTEGSFEGEVDEGFKELLAPIVQKLQNKE